MKGISEDAIRRILTHDHSLYSLWIPGDIEGACISVTDASLRKTFDLIIDDAKVFTCVEHLIRHGTPVVASTPAQTRHTDGIERQFALGLLPAAARDAALQAHPADRGNNDAPCNPGHGVRGT
jgi:hypothetical protein